MISMTRGTASLSRSIAPSTAFSASTEWGSDFSRALSIGFSRCAVRPSRSGIMASAFPRPSAKPQPVELRPDAFHVVPGGALEARVPQKSGRMIRGDDDGLAERKDLPAESGERRLAARQEQRGESPERAEDSRRDEADLLHEVGPAGGDLLRERVAIPGRAALEDVRDVHLVARQADGGEDLGQELAGSADERDALQVFLAPGGLADEHEGGGRAARAEDEARARAAQRALHALLDLVMEGVERSGRLAGVVAGLLARGLDREDAAPAARRAGGGSRRERPDRAIEPASRARPRAQERSDVEREIRGKGRQRPVSSSSVSTRSRMRAATSGFGRSGSASVRPRLSTIVTRFEAAPGPEPGSLALFTTTRSTRFSRSLRRPSSRARAVSSEKPTRIEPLRFAEIGRAHV